MLDRCRISERHRSNAQLSPPSPCLPTCVTPTTRRFSNVCELDIMFSLETTHHIIDEMIANGCIVETNKANALTPVQLLERVS